MPANNRTMSDEIDHLVRWRLFVEANSWAHPYWEADYNVSRRRWHAMDFDRRFSNELAAERARIEYFKAPGADAPVTLWYDETSTDQRVRAQAFVVAGVLSATASPGFVPNLENHVLRLPWCFPDTATFPLKGRKSDIDLAPIWAQWRTTDVRRVVLDLGRGAYQGELTALCEILPAAIPDIPFSLATFAFAPWHDWQWPLRWDAPLADNIYTVIGQQNAARRGFLRRTIDGADILFGIDAANSSRDLDFGVQFVLVGQDWQRLVADIPIGFGRPLAMVPIEVDELGKFANAFAYAISHNQPLDVALFEAHHSLSVGAPRSDATARPLLFLPRSRTIEVLDAVRIQSRIRELAIAWRDWVPEFEVGPADEPQRRYLGISDRARTSRQYATELLTALAEERLRFDHESDGATALMLLKSSVADGAISDRLGDEVEFRALAPKGVPAASQEPESRSPADGIPSEAPDVASAEPKESEAARFTDIAIYDGHLWAGEDAPSRLMLKRDMPLVEGQRYTLAVAIRQKRIGIDSDSQPSAPVLNPRKGKAPLRVYVLARTWPGVLLEESMVSIGWPYDSDSETAYFRLQAAPLNGRHASQGSIAIRLYSETLDLLDLVEVFVSVGPLERAKRLGLPGPRLAWPRDADAAGYCRTGELIRHVSIHVTRGGDGYELQFSLHRSGAEPVVVPGSRSISRAALESLMRKVRDFWTDLVVSSYATRARVTRPTFERHLRRLADLGMSAWSMLFGDGFAAMSRTSEVVGELLTNFQRAVGACVQVTYARDAEGFVFPWAILCPPHAVSEPVSPDWFWGTCYQIEQVRDGPRQDHLDEEPVQVTFALDGAFGDAVSHERALQELVLSSGGRVTLSEPVKAAQSLFERLGSAPPSHMYYFFGHGYAPSGGAIAGKETLEALKKAIEKLAPDAPERAPWDTLLSLTAAMGDEAWLFIGGAQVGESALKRQKFFNPPRRPLIFLNMCQSADIAPSMGNGLLRLFLDRNAAAVIGTECTMTSTFADPFAKSIFGALLSGMTVGLALLNARRRFAFDGNPLGLAYTLYGRATLRLGQSLASGRG